jgi:hypothetical protein
MKEKEDIQKEANELEIDLTCVVNKTRDGYSLFQRLAEYREQHKRENALSLRHEKKALAECKIDYLREQDGKEADWAEIINLVRPVNTSSQTTASASYFEELNKQWESIRRTPALDVNDQYSAPVELSAILRPFLSTGGHFNFSKSSTPLLPFDLGASYPPLPPPSEAQQEKRLKRVMSRLEVNYKRRGYTSTKGIVELSMLQSFVLQMKENDKVIQSFEQVSYLNLIEPTKPSTDSNTETFTRKNAKISQEVTSSNSISTSTQSDLFLVKQVRDMHRHSEKHNAWERQHRQLLEWNDSEEGTVDLVR